MEPKTQDNSATTNEGIEEKYGKADHTRHDDDDADEKVATDGDDDADETEENDD